MVAGTFFADPPGANNACPERMGRIRGNRAGSPARINLRPGARPPRGRKTRPCSSNRIERTQEQWRPTARVLHRFPQWPVIPELLAGACGYIRRAGATRSQVPIQAAVHGRRDAPARWAVDQPSHNVGTSEPSSDKEVAEGHSFLLGEAGWCHGRIVGNRGTTGWVDKVPREATRLNRDARNASSGRCPCGPHRPRHSQWMVMTQESIWPSKPVFRREPACTPE